MAFVDVQVVGLQPVQRMTIAMQSFTNYRLTLLRQLGNLLRAQHTRRVLSEKTSPDGAAWAPEKPSTLRRKGKSNILVETGKMANAWNLMMGPSSVRMSNSARSSRGGAFYLRFHQYGTRFMVARTVMGFSKGNMDEIAQAANAFVARRLGLAAA